MPMTQIAPMPKLGHLTASLAIEDAVRIEIQEGVPIFRASPAIQLRIRQLLSKQQVSSLSTEEERELDGFEEIDDYLSFVNRVVRNLLVAETPHST